MKRPLFLLIFISLITVRAFGQSTMNGDTTRIYTPDRVEHLEIMPLYPGGTEGFNQDLNAALDSFNLKTKKNTRVEVLFVVDTSGAITNIVILKSGGEKLDAAVISALGNMKTFVPARMDTKRVSMTIKLPIRFR